MVPAILDEIVMEFARGMFLVFDYSEFGFGSSEVTTV